MGDRIEIYFADRPVGLLYIDCLVEEAVIVELKAFPHLLTGMVQLQAKIG
ncbi:MAG TPA: GxxExxY protein [Thermoflexia bacterium]|nr:MAG: hypothetical protein DRI80_15975 [Chloroflexota bacterium]HEY68595.1 GxxExxY protein [Thermoflexia bacterium]